MPPANTTQPLDWRPDGEGGETAWKGDEVVGGASYDDRTELWLGSVLDVHSKFHSEYFPTASAARSFVERFVMEAGHGE
ncbi:hypothetical protein [Methylobacterium sp. WL19]|uniref:hypothetical protein n=1 Tax=Methylobacterium sp. WL19 TaxID=2603896 RepID=UPI0011CB535A|nr:hypothetical protein [Methylobacterium sp. WL19]TXN33944.1 hypothetical protein FV220_00405 [Methylobacterium sp. WL19]